MEQHATQAGPSTPDCSAFPPDSSFAIDGDYFPGGGIEVGLVNANDLSYWRKCLAGKSKGVYGYGPGPFWSPVEGCDELFILSQHLKWPFPLPFHRGRRRTYWNPSLVLSPPTAFLASAIPTGPLCDALIDPLGAS